MLLGVQNAAGEWVAIAAATPLSAPQYLHKSTRMDWNSWLCRARKSGENGLSIFPMNTLGEMRSGVLRAWAMDFPRRILYRLPGDQNFSVMPSLTGHDATPL